MKNTNVLKIKDLQPSKTNAAGRTSGPEFDELVASVKELGVLVPLLVRAKGKGYEVIAGHRRLAAATEAKLEEVPVRVVEMNDTEAREAQIVENLQRKDLHPIDEGIAYRDLIENAKPKLDVKEVAAKVGKSETYVRGRLVLTNLDSKIALEVRQGKLQVAIATELGRVSKPTQIEAVKRSKQYSGGICSVAEMRSIIADIAFTEVRKSPPWKDDAAMKAEIARITGLDDEKSQVNLFGEKGLAKIENPADYARALAAYIQLTIEKYKSAGKPLTLISTEYSTRVKGLKGRSEYNIGAGVYASARIKCKSGHDALVVDGDKDLGKVIKICSDKKCPAHNYQSDSDSPVQSEKRRTARKNEIAKEKAKRAVYDKGMAAAVARMKWPFTPKQLDSMLEIVIRHANHDAQQQTVKRRKLAVVIKKTSYGNHRSMYDTLVKAAKSMTPKEKAGLMFELLVPSYSPHSTNNGGNFKKV